MGDIASLGEYILCALVAIIVMYLVYGQSDWRSDIKICYSSTAPLI
ncbi:hypothetical protein [Schaalia sp. lx-260]|nr:hypothetical protein [Schaalia sp. lx-260]MCD4550302.1 hypothetical protein [Schaalia sp. lx-260]